jgi:hypothetical protein
VNALVSPIVPSRALKASPSNESAEVTGNGAEVNVCYDGHLNVSTESTSSATSTAPDTITSTAANSIGTVTNAPYNANDLSLPPISGTGSTQSDDK